MQTLAYVQQRDSVINICAGIYTIFYFDYTNTGGPYLITTHSANVWIYNGAEWVILMAVAEYLWSCDHDLGTWNLAHNYNVVISCSHDCYVQPSLPSPHKQS